MIFSFSFSFKIFFSESSSILYSSSVLLCSALQQFVWFVVAFFGFVNIQCFLVFIAACFNSSSVSCLFDLYYSICTNLFSAVVELLGTKGSTSESKADSAVTDPCKNILQSQLITVMFQLDLGTNNNYPVPCTCIESPTLAAVLPALAMVLPIYEFASFSLNINLLVKTFK